MKENSVCGSIVEAARTKQTARILGELREQMAQAAARDVTSNLGIQETKTKTTSRQRQSRSINALTSTIH